MEQSYYHGYLLQFALLHLEPAPTTKLPHFSVSAKKVQLSVYTDCFDFSFPPHPPPHLLLPLPVMLNVEISEVLTELNILTQRSHNVVKSI